MVPLFKNNLIMSVFNIFRESSNELVKQGPFRFIPSLVFSYITKVQMSSFYLRRDVILENLLSSTKVW